MAVMELGKIRQLGSPVEFFHRPANLFVAAFIGSTPMNLLNGKVRDGKVQIGSTQIGVPTSVKSVAEGQEVVFGVRPEYVQVASAQSGGFTGVVKVLENLGTHYLVSIDCNGILVRGTAPDGAKPELQLVSCQIQSVPCSMTQGAEIYSNAGNYSDLLRKDQKSRSTITFHLTCQLDQQVSRSPTVFQDLCQW